MTSTAAVEVFADATALTQAAASRVVDILTRAQSARGHASVVLTGGGTGIAVLDHVRRRPGAVDWGRLEVFWGDERYVPKNDDRRNELQAREALLDHVPVDPARVHPCAAADGTNPDPVVAAADYAATVREYLTHHGGFDLHLLGMGGEGHINSLFPHTDAVREQHAWAVAVTDSPKPPPVRITLTLPAVQQARNVLLVVAGQDKSAAVAAALAKALPADIPASGALGTQTTTWLLDRAAASGLD